MQYLAGTIPRMNPSETQREKKGDREVGLRLRRAREEKGLSQEYVAEKLAVTNKAVSQWEGGWVAVSLTRLRQLAGLYERDLGWIIDGARAYPESDPALAPVLSRLTPLDQQRKARIAQRLDHVLDALLDEDGTA